MRIEKQEYSEEQGTILDEDIYPATLKGFGEMEGQFGARLVWQFDVHAEGEDVEAAAFTSYSMAEKPRKSNLLKFAEALNSGKDPEGIDLDDLVGKPCRVEITNYTKQNGITKNKVNDVKKPGRGQKGKEAAPTGGGSGGSGTSDVENIEEDFDQIPFRHINATQRIVDEIL